MPLSPTQAALFISQSGETADTLASLRYCKENGKTPRQFTQGALKLLMDYDWPGNVRELENVVERAVVLSTQERVDVDLLPENIRSKEIVRGVRLQLSEFLPPMPGESGSRSAADHPQPRPVISAPTCPAAPWHPPRPGTVRR